MPKPSSKKPDIEFAPEVWERFERLVKSAAKVGHMPHDTNPPKAVRKRAAKEKQRRRRPAR